MAFIGFSTGTINYLQSNWTGNASRWEGLFYTGSTNPTYLKIMKGTVPTQTEIDQVSLAQTPFKTYRSADDLIIWTANGQENHPKYTASVSGTIVTINADLTYALASGTATWAMIGSNNSAVDSMVVLTISTPGNGGDIEIADTNIVQNNIYNISNLQFTMPKYFTW